jgi:signal transduction histidine kinase
LEKEKILIADDEERIRDMIKEYVSLDNYEVEEASDGVEALNLFRENKYSLIILDVMMPRMDGWSVCREIRKTSHVPIIMLTARGEEYDKLFGFELRVDDYIVKPFSPKELLARMKAIIRRSTLPFQDVQRENKAVFEGLVIEFDSRNVYVDGNIVSLTPKEYKLLNFFVRHPNRVFSREQLRKDLIANVSHELRTPLSLIRGYAETIRDVSGNVPEKRERQLDIIIEESERLSKIVDDILNLSQMQAGYLNLNPGRFMINKTIEDAVKRYDILSEKTGIKIIFENTGDIIVTADEQRIEQVLYNLINNAFNHTPEGGSITVKVIDGQHTVKVEVSDTGTGISDEDIKHVWDRYYKADKTSGRKMVGTGLGLAIVKSILDAHKALYGVESKKGTGTTFWFELQK